MPEQPTPEALERAREWANEAFREVVKREEKNPQYDQFADHVSFVIEVFSEFHAQTLTAELERGKALGAREVIDGIVEMPQPTYEDDGERDAYETATDDCAGVAVAIASKHERSQ